MEPEPDGEGGDAGNETVDVDAGGAETIDHVLGGADPGPVTTPTRARVTTRRRRGGSSGGMFAATQAGQDATLGEDDEPVGRIPPANVIPAGTVLASRYHIGALVGQGGMGTVYAARDADLDEDVALKLLRPDLACDDGYRARLRGEVRLARRVSHPNVCRVHDFGIAGDLVFVTMELVSGRTLRQLLAEMRAGRRPPFELAQVVDVIVQIGSALTAAHRAGVIHRDVKPDNMILTDGRAVLTDFGIATRSADRGEALAGTPAYLAPEVLRHEPFDHKVDVYALAVVAFELIAGHTPFFARTIEAAAANAARRSVAPELPDDLATPEVRAALDRVFSRALAADPLQRTPSVDRFTESFAFAARGAPAAVIGAGPGAARRPGPDATPPGSLPRASSPTDPGSVSGATPVRRPEVRVATALAWRFDGEDPARALAAAEAAERVVVDAGGSPIRVAPGEVIALFGVPRSSGDDADRAARAALDAVAALGGRAGLDTTRILLRPADGERIGPEVAFGAAALAATAGPGEVVASPGAARQLAARFDTVTVRAATDRDAMTPDARAARRVIGIRASTTPPSIQTYRAKELAALEAHVERAFQERFPVCVDVQGVSGTGKTRLREALVAAVSARREVDWLVAVGSPVGTPAPLATIATASREWYDAATGSGAITDPARRDNAARRWLEARATRRPVVVIVEDVQWADPSTRALLDHLRAGLDDVPVAILTFTRIDDAPAPVAPGVEVVTLDPLDDVMAARMVRAVAPVASPDAIAGVVARAAGNPFFLEELARELADGRTATLPASIEAVIQARLDHLPEAASQVALAGAVIGRAFWRSLVATLTELDGAELDAALAVLARRGVVAATSALTLEDQRYQFLQGLVRDAAYARIPPRDRREHHRVIAAWLEARASGRIAPTPGGERSDDLALLLDAAHHREQAGDAVAAAATYRKAGTRCLALFAYGEAATAFQHAIALTPVPDASLQEDLGDALAETAGPAAAEEAYRAASLVLPAADAPGAARLAYKLGLAAARKGEPMLAIDRYRAGLAIIAPDGVTLQPWAHADPRTAAKLLGGLGWTLGYQLARVEEGHPLCERAVALLEDTPYRRELAHALSRLGGTYMRACRFADQLSTNERNLEISRELGDLNMQVTAHINLGVVHGLLGSIDEAVTETVAARVLAAKIGATASAGLAASNHGGLLIEQADLDGAEVALDEALDLIERTGHRYVLCETYAYYGRLAAARGDLVSAHRHAERSGALAIELRSPIDGAIAKRLLAQIESRAGHHAVARVLIDEAHAAAAGIDRFEATRTRAARARILLAAGDPAAAAGIASARAELAALGAMRDLEVLETVTEVR